MALPSVSTFTIWCVLREAGYSWQKTRSWCPTGSAIRKRKDGRVARTLFDTYPRLPAFKDELRMAIEGSGYQRKR